MNEKSTLALLLVIPFYSLALGECSAIGDSTTSPLLRLKEPDCINLQVGISFAGNEHQGGWGTPLAFSLSYGTQIAKQVMLFANLDYYQYHLASGGDMTFLWSPSSGKREDVAAYASLCLGRLLVFGIGAYYTKCDSVYFEYNPSLFNGTPWQGGGLSELRFFYIFGAAYDIKIVDGIFLPIGLFVRQSYGDRVAPIFFRTGLGVRL